MKDDEPGDGNATRQESDADEESVRRGSDEDDRQADEFNRNGEDDHGPRPDAVQQPAAGRGGKQLHEAVDPQRIGGVFRRRVPGFDEVAVAEGDDDQSGHRSR